MKQAKRPAGVPADATMHGGSWYQGRIQIERDRDGDEQVVCHGFVREWRANGELYQEGEWDAGEPTMLRSFHPDGTLSHEIHYQGRGMARREHGVRVWQRYAKEPSRGFPINEAREVWRLEETYKLGRRTKVRRMTRAECLAAASSDSATSGTSVTASSKSTAKVGASEREPGPAPATADKRVTKPARARKR